MTDELLMDAVGMIDDDLITDVAPRRSVRIAPLAGIAAAILLLIGIGVLYAIFVMPSSAVYLDSRESVKLTLNSRGRVLSANGFDGLDGMTAEVAVAAVTRDMIDSGAIDAKENTLILGTERLSEHERATLTQTVQNVFTESRFHGAIISLPCTDRGAKAAVIDLLLELDQSLKQNNLRKLSVNALNLLLHEYATDEAQLIGEPSAPKNRKQAVAEIKKAAAEPDPVQPQLIDGTEAAAVTPPMVNAPYSAPTQGGAYAAPQPTDAASQPEAETVAPASDPSAATATEPPAEEPTAYTPPIIANPFAPIATQPTDRPTESPTTPATTAPTESPIIDMDSLIVNIPYDELIRYADKIPDFSDGPRIPLTPITPSWQWRMNWHSVTPTITKSEVMQRGKQDKTITVFCTYDDFATYCNDISIEWSAYLQTLRNDGRFNEDFFRENALVMVRYSDYTAYTNETDSISRIEINNETAYVTLQRVYRPEVTYHSEIDLYKCVVSAAVKKSDIKNIKDLKLIVIAQSAE